DPVGRPLRREGLRQLVHRRLGSVVRGLHLRPVDDLRGDRADVDDHAATVVDHVTPERLAAAPQAVEVDVDDVLPLVVGDLERRPVDACAGVVDQDVDTSMPLDDRVARGAYVGGVTDVEGDSVDIAADARACAPSAPIVGLDVGTSSVKGVAVATEDGRVLGVAESRYGLSHPRPGWSEQDPEDWWRATRDVLERLGEHGAPAGIGLSGQMHG